MSDCATCSSANICTKCKNNLFLDSDGKGCIDDCATKDSASIFISL